MKIFTVIKENSFYFFIYILFSYNNLVLGQTNKEKKYMITLEKIDDDHTQLYGEIYFGSNNQPIQMLLNTEESLTYVPSVECLSCQNNITKLYNFQDSTHFVNLGEQKPMISHHNTKLIGDLVSDSLSLMDSTYNKHVKLENFHFLLVKEVENLNSNQTGLFGSVGLGLSTPKIENDKNNSNIILQLYQQKAIEHPRFSIFISDNDRLKSKLFLGDFSHGTIISNLYNKMSYFNSEKSQYGWECDLNQIEINKKVVTLSSVIKISTSSYSIIAPITDYKLIKRVIFDKLNIECGLSEINQLQCKCNNPNIFSSFKFSISNSVFDIPAINIMDYSPENSYQCKFHVNVDLNNIDTWTLGTVAMKNNLFSFDLKTRKIGYHQFQNDAQFYMNYENMIIEEKDDVSNKFGYIFTLIFILLLVFGLYKCANNEKFVFPFRFRKKTDDFGYNNVDNKKMEMIKNQFNSEEYDYDFSLSKKEKSKTPKLVEMKDMPEAKI